MPTIRLETQIYAPIQYCFDLARDVDVHRESAMQTHERAVAGITTGLLEQGDVVTWEGTHFGMRQHLTVRITEFEKPRRFVDEMVRGAFRELRHVHDFSSCQGGTIMIDTFEFKSPFGYLGSLFDALVLTRYFRTFLYRRNMYLKEVAEKKHLASTQGVIDHA